MRRGEAGFTLIELVVTVGILVMLLAVGGFWMLGMRPGALRSALDDFDANLASAKAFAATSGNGATLIFEPKSNGSPGYTLAVYSGRPTAADAVTATTTMIGNSSATVTEAHFGSPPFAIFLSSAGYPTGIANYPTLKNGAPNFATIATEPPCPSGGIVLTFTSPQGVTASRTLPCNVVVSSVAGTDPTPTPNPLKIEPTYLLAHSTTDSGPLKFKAIEYGYYHWYESTIGQECQTQSSDTGAAPAVFASPWPYAQPSPASQGATAPAPPSVPYTWPVGDPNDPPAVFQLLPVLHNGGICTVTVADDYGQLGTPVAVQVMGDLHGSPAPANPLPLTAGQPATTLNFGKTFDGEQLLLSVGDLQTQPCAKFVTVQASSGSTPAQPSTVSAGASVTVTPIAQGSCVMIVQDQYGEQVQVPINVKRAWQNFGTWPGSLVLGLNGATIAQETNAPVEVADADHSFGPVINALLGGGVARAQSLTYTGLCYAQAFTSGTSGPADTSLPQDVVSALGDAAPSVTNDGCMLNAAGSAQYGDSSPTGVIVAYEPPGSGQTGNFQSAPLNCSSIVQLGSWYPGETGAQAIIPAAGASPGACAVTISDGNSTQTAAPDAGAIAVSVACGSSEVAQNGTCDVVFVNQIANCVSYNIINNGTTNICTGLVPADPTPNVLWEYEYTPQADAAQAFQIGEIGATISPNGLCQRPVYGFLNTSLWAMFAAYADPANVATTIGVQSATNIPISNSTGLSVPNEPQATISLDTIDGSISSNPYVTPAPPPQQGPWPPECGGGPGGPTPRPLP